MPGPAAAQVSLHDRYLHNSGTELVLSGTSDSVVSYPGSNPRKRLAVECVAISGQDQE
jgi:hypothetical protein